MKTQAELLKLLAAARHAETRVAEASTPRGINRADAAWRKLAEALLEPKITDQEMKEIKV